MTVPTVDRADWSAKLPDFGDQDLLQYRHLRGNSLGQRPAVDLMAEFLHQAFRVEAPDMDFIDLGDALATEAVRFQC